MGLLGPGGWNRGWVGGFVLELGILGWISKCLLRLLLFSARSCPKTWVRPTFNDVRGGEASYSDLRNCFWMASQDGYCFGTNPDCQDVTNEKMGGGWSESKTLTDGDISEVQDNFGDFPLTAPLPTRRAIKAGLRVFPDQLHGPGWIAARGRR